METSRAKRILVVYATAGIGHKKAAVAVKAALDEIAPKDAEIMLVDALDYSNKSFKKMYLDSYLFMVNKLPLVWGLSYYMTDNPLLNKFVSVVRRFNNWLNSGRFAEFLLEWKPDVVVSTHFYASEVISELKRRGVVTTKLYTVVTDFRLHSWWVADNTDLYIVGSEDAKIDLLRWKVPPSRIEVFGIPAEPVFSKKVTRREAIEKTGLADGVFTILVIGGGFGVGPIESVVKALGSLAKPAQVVVICGHNKELVARVERLKPLMKGPLKALGYTDNVYDYMSAADVLISKSGGITVTESLIKELPMVIISPILGQETRNCEFLLRYQAAQRMNAVSDVKAILDDLMAYPEKVEKMRDGIRAVRKPMACYDIAKYALNGK